MSRERLDYTARTSAQTVGFDPDTPVPGYYRMRLRSGGVLVGIRIWWGQPLDPIDGTPLDRSLRWNATANGRPIDLERAWPKCAADPITEAEAAYLATVQEWGEKHAPDSPQANPQRRINPLTAPTPF